MNAVVRPAVPLPAPVTGFAFAVQVAKAIVIASALFLLGNYAINLALSQISKEPVREHLRQAFNDGDLGIISARKMDSGMGVHQLNDCLIYDMAARDAGEQWLYYLFATQHTAQQSEDPPERCEQLRNWVLNDPKLTFRENWYQRYIHGYRSVAIVLVSIFSVADSRLIMKIASYGVFVALCLFNLLALSKRLKATAGTAAARRDQIFASNELAYVGLGISFILFFGLPYFGQSISHAPAIVTLGVFLIAWSHHDLRGQLDLTRMIRLVILYSLFTTAFEFLTGYIPVGCVLLCLLVAISDRGTRFETPGALIARLVAIEAVFVATIAVVMSMHLIATSMFSPEADTLANFFQKLAIRASASVGGAVTDDGAVVGATEVGIAEVVAEFFKQIRHLGVPTHLLGLLTLCLAGGLIVVGLGEIWLSSASHDAKWRAATIAIALVPLALWIGAFLNHSVIHAGFMVRILVAIPITAATMLFWWRAAMRSQTSTVPQLLAKAPLLNT